MAKKEREEDLRVVNKNSIIVSFRLNFDDPIDYKIYKALLKLPKGARTVYIKNALFLQIQREKAEEQVKI